MPDNQAPNANWDLLGHEWAVDLLKKHLTQGGPRHAYLITGPDGVGRRTLALRFAQAINAPDRQYTPKLAASQQFARMQHPDLSIVQREEGDRDIKIEAVRSLQHTLSLTPYMADFRIALLLDFEQASAGASNALLKTLEEPPGRVVLLMTAESPDSLLPTITSRCEVLRLRPMPLDALAKGLEDQFEYGVEEARLLAHIAAGKPGYALELAAHPEILEARTSLLDEQVALLRGSRVERFAYAQTLAKDKDAFQQTMLVWLAYWRDILLRTAHSSAPLTNLDRQEEVEQLAQSLDAPTAHRVVSAIEDKLGELRANANPRLAAEALMLQFPHF
ncbi:MAG: DNA polymerase III subunit delta' C-terminal domain-containing protein [Anaerolineales bacterium]